MRKIYANLFILLVLLFFQQHNCRASENEIDTDPRLNAEITEFTPGLMDHRLKPEIKEFAPSQMLLTSLLFTKVLEDINRAKLIFDYLTNEDLMKFMTTKKIWMSNKSKEKYVEKRKELFSLQRKLIETFVSNWQQFRKLALIYGISYIELEIPKQFCYLRFGKRAWKGSHDNPNELEDDPNGLQILIERNCLTTTEANSGLTINPMTKDTSPIEFYETNEFGEKEKLQLSNWEFADYGGYIKRYTLNKKIKNIKLKIEVHPNGEDLITILNYKGPLGYSHDFELQVAPTTKYNYTHTKCRYLRLPVSKVYPEWDAYKFSELLPVNELIQLGNIKFSLKLKNQLLYTTAAPKEKKKLNDFFLTHEKHQSQSNIWPSHSNNIEIPSNYNPNFHPSIHFQQNFYNPQQDYYNSNQDINMAPSFQHKTKYTNKKYNKNKTKK